MQERHEHEQYFFDQATADAVADILEPYERPCVLCAPTAGIELEDRGASVTTLDVDERFAKLRSFRRWDLSRPEPIESRFDVILCDPPFFLYSLSQLFQAIRVLAEYDYGQRVAITYLARRRHAILGTFAPFGLEETGVQLGYRTVRKVAKNEIVLFANFKL